jgi:Fe(3+) dicitrate transport protein
MGCRIVQIGFISSLVFITSVLRAEEPGGEKFLWADTLKSVDIQGFRERGREWLPERDGLVLLAGKKTELIRLDDLGANTVQNQSRQLFGKAPGISVWESDGSGMQIGVGSRGLSPNRSWEFNVRQNGYDIAADPFGYPEAYYNPPSEAVESITLVRGAAGLQYGPQFGGLLDYRIRQAPADRKLAVASRQSGGSYGLWSSFNALSGTVGRLSYYAFYHHRQADGWREHSRYRSDVLYGSIGYRISEKWKTSFSYTRSTNRLQQAGGLTDAQFAADARQSLRARNWFSAPWNIFTGSLQYDPDSMTSLQLSVNGLIAERNSVGFVSSVTVADTVNPATGSYAPRQVDRDFYTNFGLELRGLRRYRWLGREHALSAGLRYFHGNTRRDQRGQGTIGTGADFAITNSNGRFPRSLEFGSGNMAGFVENVFHIGKRWSLSPGLRLEQVRSEGEGRYAFNSDGSEQRLQPLERERTFLLAGLGASYQLPGEWSLYGNWSQAYRPVLFSDLTPPATTDVVDPNLRDARGHSAELGIRGKWQDRLRADVSVYTMTYGDRIGNLSRTNADGSSYLYRTNLGNSLHRGLEAYVEVNPLRFLNHRTRVELTLWNSLALMKATYGDFPLASPVNGTSNLDGKLVEYAPALIHRCGASFLLGDFRAELQYSYTGKVYADAGNTELPTANGQAGVIPAWTVWDASAGYTYKERYELKVNLSNLFDDRYFTRRSGGYPGPGLLPGEARTLIVTVGMKL